MAKKPGKTEGKAKGMTFEKALDKLEGIVGELETGDLSLEASLAKYEEGIRLASACQEKLDKAKAKIEMLIRKDNGRFDLKDLDEGSGE